MTAAELGLKLRRTPWAELRSRAGYWAYCRAERVAVALTAPGGQTVDRDRIQAPPEAPRFFASTLDATPLCAMLAERFPRYATTTVARANRIVRGRMRLFGRWVQFRQPPDWTADPFTGWRWPQLYHRDVLRVATTDAPADVKHVWELNRHQFLPDLAIAFRLTGDVSYTNAVAGVIDSWCAQNPPKLGVNWCGPLEVAYRALSWLWTYAILAGGETLPARTVAVWSDALHHHGRFLYRHLESHSSPYNHLIGEAAVLFLLGLAFPGRTESRAWERRGRRVLEERLDEQFYRDGGSVEQATGYHHATLGFYLLAYLFARECRRDLSPRIAAAIERGIEWSMRMAQPDGRVPAIGDNDDARPIRFASVHTGDFRLYQGVGAVLFGRADFKAQTRDRLTPDAAWLLGPGALAAFDAVDSRRPANPSSVLPESGYVVLRSNWSAAADYLCLDLGPQAGGLSHDNVRSAAHGHADCLSVIAWLNGVPILVDPGFYTYNGAAAWEQHFRDTGAHNTVVVAGRGQSHYHGRMVWSATPRSGLLDCGLTEAASCQWARGWHDGYVGRHGVMHHRTVVLKPGAGFAILDQLSGTSPIAFSLGFQFAPHLRPVLQGRGTTGAALPGHAVHIHEDCRMTIRADIATRVALVRGGAAPDRGWVAPRLGQLVPAPRLVVEGETSASGTSILTLVSATTATWDAATLEDWPLATRPVAAALLAPQVE